MRPGDEVGGRFRVESEALLGGMAAVFRARDLVSGRSVALKVLERPDEERLARFWREAEVLDRLRHPRILPLVAHGTTGEGEPFLVMDWLEGHDLAVRLEQGPLDTAEALAIVRHVADALAVAHQAEIVHRDIKPANLFLVGGDVEKVVVLDFGIARVMAASGVTKHGSTLGTPSYMAPEQARGQPDIDARADVFSLGCVLYHCLTGRPPFVADSPLAVLAKVVFEDPPALSSFTSVSHEIARLCARMLAKEREERFADAISVRAAASSVADGARDAGAISPAVTSSEQSLCCVILAQTSRAERPAAGALGRVLANEADHYGGRVERLADESVVVVLENAEDATDLVTRAASCALAMRVVAPGAPIALATGRGQVRDGALVGEAIERVAHLVDADEAAGSARAGIAVDELTAGLLGEGFEVRAGPIHGTWYAERAKGSATAYPQRLPFVGRSDEIAQLLAVFERSVRRASLGWVLVTGPAGMGKSRLGQAFVDRLESGARGHRSWRVRADPQRARVPFGLASEIVWRGLGAPRGASREDLRFAVTSAASVIEPGPDRTRVVEFLAEMLGIGEIAPVSPSLRAARHDPFLMNDQIRSAFAEWLRAETADRPLTIVADDLHFCDRKSLELFDDLRMSLADRPLVLVGLARPAPIDWAERLAFRDAELPLEGLSLESCNLLAKLALDSASSDDIDWIVKRADGNPRVLEELIRGAGRGERGELPPTVLALSQARLAKLAPELRRLLRAASVLGVSFSVDGVAALTGQAPEELEPGLGRLAAEGLVAPLASSDTWEFRSEIDRAAAYEMLAEEDRRAGHRVAARWISAQSTAAPLEIAEHHEGAGEQELAAGHYLLAAEQANAHEDLEAARHAAERALDCASPSDVELRGRARLVLAQAYRWLADYRKTDVWGRLALEDLPPGTTRWFLACGLVTVAAARLASFATVDEIARRVLSEPPATSFDGTARDVALGRVAWAQLISGRMEQAAETLATIDASDRRDEEITAAPHARAMGLYAAASGDVGLAATHWTRAVTHFEAIGNAREAAAQRINLGFALVTLGQYERAADILQRARAAARALRLSSVEAGALQNLGIALSRRGLHEEACRYIGESIEAFSAQGDRRLEVGSRIYASEALLGAGDLSAALREAEAASRGAASLPPMACVALAALARVLLADERYDEAVEASSQAIRILDELRGVEEGESLIYGAHVRGLCALGRTDEARAIAARGRSRLLERASKIEDLALRASFLEQVADNRELAQLADALRAPGADST